ncbi:MAG: Mur ligase family protein, partial [Eubacteriaceae bacterium]|nr:Mur ligase family protein [Eubacteriaceae bacterium]
MEQSLNNLKGKKILVVGLGRSGIAACKALVKQEAQVFVQDSKNAEAIDGELMSFLNENCVKGFYGEKPDDMSLFDMLVLSPGVSPELDFVCEAEKAGSEIIGELELAYRLGKGKYIGITGTNGKTTTTTLVGEIFKNDKRKTHGVGNIGVAVVSASVDADDYTWHVTETTSFKQVTKKHIRPVVSANLKLNTDQLK